MELYRGHFYHLYNRSNNNELVFKSHENYLFFLKKYRFYFESLFTTLAYCLMPTHFHFMILVESSDMKQMQTNIGILLSSYTKSINKYYQRHGSLFQNHTKTVLVQDEGQLLLTTAYIHRNPVRAKFVKKPEEWPYSSYPEYIGKRIGTLPDTGLILAKFSSLNEFISFSQRDFTGEEKDVIMGKKPMKCKEDKVKKIESTFKRTNRRHL